MIVNTARRTWPVAAVVVLCALSACAGTAPQQATDKQTNTQMSQDPAAPPAESSSTAAMTCDASKAQAFVGKTATQSVVDKVVADSGSHNARVLKPGDAMTMDYREDRVNIEVDAMNAIKTIRCG